MNNKAVGERIKELRELRKMNCNELANKAGISPTYIYQLERGEKSPTVEYLGYICWALQISLAEFFSVQDKPSEDEVSDRISSLTFEQQRLLNLFLNSLNQTDADCRTATTGEAQKDR